ncbi:MAG: DUF1616 domain-containing protein [Methanobacteriaceae archaeon]|nr:DUF1616 domain-containing protein [Methanobacteriaceae archaeon]
MKLSSQKDLLLVIILSLVVLILTWLQLFKGYTLTFITTILILFLPGYAIITAIWPTDERMGWDLRTGIGFVLGLFFLLFLPLILNSLSLKSVESNLNNLIFIIAILLSLLAMARRSGRESEEEPSEMDYQLTLEESIERAAYMRRQAREEQEYEDLETYPPEEPPIQPDELGEEEFLEEETPDLQKEGTDYLPEEEPDELDYESWKEEIKKQKPLQYERIKDKEEIKNFPLRVERPVKTDVTTSDYEKEMDTPVWWDEPAEEKSGFKYWDLLIILFLSGVSLLFLCFNPLKTTATSVVFFILLLFILGYAALTIIFPDKSRASSRDLILASVIVALVLFTLSFLAFLMHLLPSLPNYMVGVMLVASVVLVAGAFLRKWRATKGEDELEEEPETQEITAEEKEFTTPEDLHKAEKAEKSHEKLVQESEESKKKDTLLEGIGHVVKTVDTKRDEDGESLGEKTPVDWVKPRYPFTDLLLVVAITILTAAFVLIPPLNQTFIRTILGILLVLFIPGYALIAALFPKRDDLDGIERAALSFGLSIAVTPLIGLALNYTPWGIRLDPILISLTIFTLSMCLVAFLRRKKLTDEERFSVPFSEFMKGMKESFQGESKIERILSIILIISIILAIATTVYIIVKPKEGEKFTEFYILGPNGTASNYPTNLTTGQNGTVIIGVVNHEYATTDYKLVVKVNNSTLKQENLTLSNGEKVEIPYTFTAGTSGQKKMEFLLYKLPDNETVYRSLHLWLNVK